MTTPKPDWIGDAYPTYGHIVRSWGFEVLDIDDTKDYQGDYAVLLADGDRRGFTTFGYGSCSGCDVLEDITPWEVGDDWSAVVALRDEMRGKIEWRDTAAELADYLSDLDPANHWWLHDEFMKGKRDEYVATLRS